MCVTSLRKRERVWYHAYTSSVPVESAECNNYDVNFIMRVLTKWMLVINVRLNSYLVLHIKWLSVA